MKTHQLISILKTFDPQSEPVLVFASQKGQAGTHMEDVVHISDNNGSPQFNSDSFVAEMHRHCMSKPTMKKFWAVIDQLGWSKDAHPDDLHQAAHRLCEKELICFHEAETIQHELHGKLMDKLSDQEANRWRYKELNSDDGVCYMIDHIIGLGEVAYKAALKKPRLAIERFVAQDYQEGFGYVFMDHIDDEPAETPAKENLQ